MKKWYYLISLFVGVLFLTSCKEPTQGGGAPAGSEQATSQAMASSLVGYWVNEAWWEELQATKSPRKAFAKLDGIAGAIMLQDSARITANLAINWHEGAQYAVREREGKQELYDPTNAAVQPMPLTFRSEGAITLDKSNMVRLATDLLGVKIVGHTIFGGQWDYKGKTVVFNPDGTVVNIDGFRFYEPQLDYVVDQTGADEFSLSADGGSPVFFAFKIEGNKLTISELVDEGGTSKVGKVKYEMTKK
ncbi:MAG: hypothetical protein MUC59_11760 [Saprospiraceae bacterium]|nr:hypothetical protein [Saprospiraceae bacterium]